MDRIHSFVDVITNSSTEIFVSAHDGTIQSAKELAQKVLDFSGSDKKADDIFNFEIKYEEVECYECATTEYAESGDGVCPRCKGSKWSMIIPTQEEAEEHYNDYNEGYGVSSYLVATSKESGEVIDFELDTETEAIANY